MFPSAPRAALSAVLISSALFGLEGASAQLSGLTGLSSSCQSTATSLLFGNLGSCLSLTSLLPVLSASGSIVSPLNSYLTTLCSESPCSNSTIQSGESSIESGCSSDIQSGSTLVTGLDTILQNYNGVRNVACLKNTSNNTLCITQTLSALQNATGQQVTLSLIESLISGSSSSSELSTFTNVDASVLCTECVRGMYEEAVKANSTVAQSPVASAISSKCGSNFASQSASGISGPSSTASMGSASSSASSSGQSSGAIPQLALGGTAVSALSLTALGLIAGVTATFF